MLNLSLQDILIRVLALTLSLSFHEFAHAWSAHRLGDDTAKNMGRLTMNPRAHLDPIGTLMVLVAGVGWAKPVPVNPARFDRDRNITVKKGMLLTSVAGPVANLILATLAMIAYELMFFIANVLLVKDVMISMTLYEVFQKIFLVLISMNIGLAFFNLIPVPPLDGSRIFGSLLPDKYYYTMMRYERYIGIIFLVLVFFGSGLIGKIIYFLSYPFRLLVMMPLHKFFSWLLTLVI